MQKPSNKLRTVWNTVHGYSNQSTSMKPENWTQFLSNIFCPGPFYYYTSDFSCYEFPYVHPHVEQVLGMKANEVNLDTWAARLHTDDLGFMQRAEVLVGDFLMKKLPPSQIMNYKVSYCIRLRKSDETYAMILHQTFATSLDENNRILTTFGVHSDISHITMVNSNKVSFTSMIGEKSYIGIDVNKAFDLKQREQEIRLTKRERQILGHLSEGCTVGQISEMLPISKDTVRTHRNNIRKKFKAKNTTEMVAKAIRIGLI
ncbi:MAG: helix-turn-helix transcriptional regulator [Bacteroidota bacterium]